MGNDLINHVYVMRPPWETQEDGVRELWGWGPHEDVGTMVPLERAQKLLAPSPLSHPLHLFLLAAPELIPFHNKLVL